MLLQCTHVIQWNLQNKETTGPRKGFLISEVSLIRRLHYSIANNSGPRTLVLISEVSAIGSFRRFHCIHVHGHNTVSGPLCASPQSLGQALATPSVSALEWFHCTPVYSNTWLLSLVGQTFEHLARPRD